MGVSWAALGFLEGLLGGLWAQKRVKTHGFLRFSKRLFKAPDGPLGLILFFLVNLFWILCKSAGPFCVSFLAFVHSILAQVKKKYKIKKNMSYFGFLF